MQSIELKGLEQLDRLRKRLESSPEVFAKARRACFEEATREAKEIVDRQIGGGGKVRSWQEATVGSRGGYARVAPKKETWTERTRKAGNRYAAGAVTNAIVSGHRFPSPSGRKYYKPRIRSGGMKVPGRPFYDQAGPQIRDLARRTAERVAEKFPGEPVYLDTLPSGFQRPSSYIQLQKFTGDAGFAPRLVEFSPVITLTAFPEADAYKNSDQREVNRRQMLLTAILMPGFIEVRDRAPKVARLELEGGTDFASVTVTFSYAVSREEFLELEEAPPMEEFRVREQLE